MRKRIYSFDKTLPDGRVVSVRIPKMPHLRANITYVCDRKCPNCNRACGVAPSSAAENMPVEAFQKVMADSVALGKKWTKIVLTGGEPSLHPDMLAFAEAAMGYKNDFYPECNVWISTYFHPKMFRKVEEAVAKFPGLQIMGNPKEKPRTHTFAPYMAPMDDPSIPADHFYAGCHLVGSLCGTTVDYKGFYCCPIAPAIARVFKLDLAVKELKDVSVDTLTAQHHEACRRCGQYTYIKAHGNEEPMSRVWQEAVRAYLDRS